jgi:hypothetical protein
LADVINLENPTMNAERRFFPRRWKPKLLGLLVPVALSVAVQGSLHAGINDWTNTGPQGGPIFVLTVDPQNPGTFHAGTNTGVFKSIDAGITWANAGMSGWTVTRLLVDPQHSSTLYALTAGHPDDDTGITQAFQSTDGGATWNETGSLPDDCCAVFTIDPQGILYVAGGYAQRDLLTSTDGGATWNTAGSLPLNYTFVDLAIDPQNAGTLYAASAGNLGGRTVGTLFKSTDRGATWSQTGSGLATSNGDFFTPGGTLAIDPKNPRTLYIAMRMSGVHKSVDGGATWSAANAGMPQNFQGCCISGVAIDPQNPSTLYAASAFSLYKSTNGGLTWSTAGSGIWQGLLGFGTRPLAVDLQNSNTVYAITQIGLFRSTDGGETFGYYSAPRAVPIFAVALDPQVAGRVYANNYASSDAGMSWQQGAGTNPEFAALAADPQTAGTVYAGFGYDECGVGSPGMFKSTDGGANWVDLRTSFGCISGIAIDPQNPATIYAGSWYGGVYKSGDGGASWTAANAGLPAGLYGAYVQALAMDPQNPETLYAAELFAGGGGGVFKSTDGGASWTGTGLQASAVALAVDPLNTSTIYAATSTTVFQSLDGGANWRDLSAVGSGSVYSVAVNPVNSAVIYAGTDSGVVMSTDGGARWTVIAGSPVCSHVLVLGAGNPNILYAGGSAGLFSALIAPRQPVRKRGGVRGGP